MSDKIKFDPKFFYGFNGKRYERQSDLPDQACKSGKHKWESVYAFGKYNCAVCGALREVRPYVDTVLKKKILSKTANKTDKSILKNPNEQKYDEVVREVLNNFRPVDIKRERDMRNQLYQQLITKIPESEIGYEQPGKKGRRDIVINEDIAIELKSINSTKQLRDLKAQVDDYAKEYKKVYCYLWDPKNIIKPKELNEFLEDLKRYRIREKIEVIRKPQ